ncbi:MAG: Holliday junction resolvase RuvX [Christensenellales bacterium]|nr:Holliday junction resolvase RuvX [Christensenellales bacterium]
MRVLCLDIGSRRIGVAVTDPLDITAQGVETIWSKGIEKDLSRVRELCAQYETDRILCGLPRNMDGSEGFQAQYVREFAQRLTDTGLSVRFQDERMTTRLATSVLLEADIRRSRRKDVVDKLAATYILQSFLDSGGWKDEIDRKLFLGGRYTMNDNHELDMEMDNELDNIVELVDEEGNEVSFVHLLTLEHKGHAYICLIPIEPMEDVDEDELVIMRIETDDQGNDVYATIDDNSELDEVFEKYLEIVEAEENEEGNE